MYMEEDERIETMIREYMDYKDQSTYYGRRKLDAEKEYNRLLTVYSGESKSYSLEQAEAIYKSHQDMILFEQEAFLAQSMFIDAENKLKDLGRILFEATITADILVTPAGNESNATTRAVTVSYNEGQVFVK